MLRNWTPRVELIAWWLVRCSIIEVWLPIPGYEGFYDVSNFGRVRSIHRYYAGGRILRQNLAGHTGNKYWHVGLHKSEMQRTWPVYRLVLLAFIGPVPEGQESRHGPAGRRNDSLVNLCYGTPVENNSIDKVRDGTISRGEINGHAVLTEEIIRKIRIRADNHESQGMLAKEFRVHPSTVSLIVSRKRWAHVI